MATTIYSVVELYNEYNATKVTGVDTWPLMENLLPVACIVTVYLLFVLKLGPQLMATREPFHLQKVLVVYNFAILTISIFLTAWVALYGWIYIISKIIELFDTVFFVLRKKYNQVSFLHVYHHTSALLYAWIYLKYLFGVQGVIIGFLNSGVHIFMYFYYMIAAMGPAYRKYIWWKKYMTWMQLVQFVMVIAYMTYLLIFNCDLPKSTSLFIISISLTYFVLFIDFYTRTYTKKIK